MHGYSGGSTSSLRNTKHAPATQKYGYRTSLKVLAPPPTIHPANEPTIWGCSHGEVCSTLELKGSQSSPDFGEVVRADRRDDIGGEQRMVKDCLSGRTKLLKHRLCQPRPLQQQEFEGMFRCSTDLMKMLNLVRTAAHTESTVPIDGETGTDKNMVGAPFFFAANSEIEPS
jgi:hypothetical protein